jgi:hypothetical protein
VTPRDLVRWVRRLVPLYRFYRALGESRLRALRFAIVAPLH